MQYIIQLETLRERIKQANRPRLFKIEIDELAGFGKAIVYFKPDITSQLSQFWELHFDLLKYLQTNEGTFAIRDRISDATEKIQEVVNMSHEIVRLLNKGKTENISANALAATGLLLIHVIRVESIEKVLLEQLKLALSINPNNSGCDPYELCSVEGKVKKVSGKRDEWRTDVRAIRDSTAHAQFRIATFKEGWEIYFSNNKGGYNFNKRFNDKEFAKFFDNFTLLYKSQLILLMLFEMLPIIYIHFLRK